MKHDCLDEVGQVIISELCHLKKVHEKYEMVQKFYQTIFMIMAFIFLGYLLVYSVIPFRFHYSAMISMLINNVYHYLFIVILVTLHYRIKFIDKKTDSAEKDYEALRCEVIQRAEELWPTGGQWEKRHLFFEEMKTTYNINLYYENT